MGDIKMNIKVYINEVQRIQEMTEEKKKEKKINPMAGLAAYLSEIASGRRPIDKERMKSKLGVD